MTETPETSPQEAFHTRLKRLRMAKGLSQQDVAERVGIKRSNFANWESSKPYGNPSREKLTVLAEIFDCTLEELVNGGPIDEDQPHPDGLPSRLYQLRKGHELTFADLAIEMGCDPTAIYHWETGKREVSISKLMWLCDRFNVSPTWLLFGERERNFGAPPSPLKQRPSREVRIALQTLIRTLGFDGVTLPDESKIG